MDRGSEVQVLWSAAPAAVPVPVRVATISSRLLGRPYLTGPLVGGPDTPEVLVTRTDGFDCVTFTETVLAAALAPTAAAVIPTLVALRYHHGRQAWLHRNHYTSDWLDRNARWLVPYLDAQHTAVTRTLSLLPGYPARTRSVRYLPVTAAPLLREHARSGDFVGFVSTRDTLDTFHVGLLIQGPGALLLRHASRSAGAVVEVPLSAFLSANETPGVLLARPRRAP